MVESPTLDFSQLSTKNYQLPKMVSAAGLAPARVGLKIRTRELLCIRGHVRATAEALRPGVSAR